jgi:hypothetical protein
MLLAIFALVCLSGCVSRTILVPAGTPVQIRKPVEADVWVFDKDGKRVEGRVVIPEGWWALDDPGR